MLVSKLRICGQYRALRTGINFASHRNQCASSALCNAQKHSVVFLGTPQVATIVLEGLLAAASKPDADFSIVAVVTQPPRQKGRGRSNRVAQVTPIHQLAIDNGVPEESILTPVSAREEEFLQKMEDLKPDLCITAAYGNFLPQKFLDTPTLGTLNVHPSLLPKYRGAAPVNRSLENGDSLVGVSVAYTVLKMDAGPVLSQGTQSLEGHEQAPEVLDSLFRLGTDILIEELPKVWDGSAPSHARAQDDDDVTHAVKMTTEEAVLDFSLPAHVLHNKVRGFAGWPGTRCCVYIESDTSAEVKTELKILRTRIGGESTAEGSVIEFSNDALLFKCGDGNVLAVTHVQPVGKKVMDAKSFSNGLNGKTLRLLPKDGTPL